MSLFAFDPPAPDSPNTFHKAMDAVQGRVEDTRIKQLLGTWAPADYPKGESYPVNPTGLGKVSR